MVKKKKFPKYILLELDAHSPTGAYDPVNDYLGTAETIEEAEKFIREHLDEIFTEIHLFELTPVAKYEKTLAIKTSVY